MCHIPYVGYGYCSLSSLQWRHNGRDGVSNHQPHDRLLNRLFRRRSRKTSKFHVTGLCVGNSPVTGEFPAQKPSNAENIFIWWRHHDAVMVPLHKYQMPCTMYTVPAVLYFVVVSQRSILTISYNVNHWYWSNCINMLMSVKQLRRILWMINHIHTI